MYNNKINYIVDASNNFEYGDGYLEVSDKWLEENRTEIIKSEIGDGNINWEIVGEYTDMGFIIVINNSKNLY